jgi:hypothetical protein
VIPQGTDEQIRVESIGCAWALLSVNALLMGLLAASFVQGPYSSGEQELWYRYGSLGFFLAWLLCPQSLCLLTVAHAGLLLLPPYGYSRSFSPSHGSL